MSERAAKTEKVDKEKKKKKKDKNRDKEAEREKIKNRTTKGLNAYALGGGTKVG